MSLLFTLVAAVLYSISSAFLTRSLAVPFANSPAFHALNGGSNEDSSPAKRRRLTFLLAAAAVVIHGWIVIHQTGLPHGLQLPLFTAMAATSLIIVLLHVTLCLKRPADYLGIAIYPVAAITLLASHASGAIPPSSANAVQIHVFLSLLAYAILALAAAQAVLVAIQRHYLSRHKPGGFIRALPPLDSTEQLLFTLLTCGFLLLSLSLASGYFYLEDMFSQRLVHKTVLSSVAWAIFGILLFGRWRYGWRGKKAVQWTLAGFGLLIVAYFGTKLVLEVLLQ